MKNISHTESFEPLCSDPAQSPTLPGYFYHHPDILEIEKEKIFFKNWQLVAHVSQLDSPGAFVCAQIVDENIFVIRGKDRAIRGFYNVCQHRAHELLEGQGRVKSLIVCPYHNWIYNTEGKLSKVRLCNKQPNFDKKNYGLVPIQVQEMLGFVFVNLDPAAPPLESLPGNMFEDIKANIPWWNEMVVSQELTAQSWHGQTLNANWKVLAENSNENYHVDPVHPAYGDMISLEKYEWQISGWWLKGLGTINKMENSAYSIESSEPSQRAITWRLWPNIGFISLPGEASFSALSYYPITPDLTGLVNITVIRPREPVKPERWDYFWKILWPEDISICESVHKGLKSRGYSQGRFFINAELPGISEYGTHFFQLLYADAIGK